MTVADTNVRPARRSPATSARGARAFRLARLVLEFLLQKLDRKAALLSLFAASLTPACVIPVGPDWQDPIGIPNGPPRIVVSDPPLGVARIADPTTNTATFSITVTDPNPGQTLHLRWLAEFPEDIPGTLRPLNATMDRLIPDAGGQPWQRTVTETFGCLDVGSLPSHKVMAIVADDFFDPAQPTGVMNKGGSDAIFWPLIITCQSQNQ